MSPDTAAATLRSVVDTNVRDRAPVEAKATAPWRGLIERNRGVANTALRYRMPVARVGGHNTRQVEWVDGRETALSGSPGGIYSWYALAAIHRFHRGPETQQIQPGRADLEFLALALHLHSQGLLHRLYTQDRGLTAAAQALGVPTENALEPDEARPRPADPAPYTREEWNAEAWRARETELACDVTGYLRPRPGMQSLYSFEVLARFFALPDAEQATLLNRRGVIRACLLDVLEVVRRCSWLGETHASESALRLAVERRPVQVIAGALAPGDYQVAASVLRLEADMHWALGQRERPESALAASDALILAAGINRAAVGHLQGGRSTVSLHFAANRIGRIRRFLRSEQLTFVRNVPGTGGRDLSTVPDLLAAVRRLHLVVGP